MKARTFLSVTTLAIFGLATTAGAAEKLACPVSGKPINKEATADYKGGKVFFCCPGCPTGFNKNTAKYAVKANKQLVDSGQAKQAGCPISGRKLDPSTAITVDGTEVSFCCKNCKATVAKLEGDAQVAKVFADKPFEKAFKVAEKDN